MREKGAGIAVSCSRDDPASARSCSCGVVALLARPTEALVTFCAQSRNLNLRAAFAVSRKPETRSHETLHSLPHATRPCRTSEVDTAVLLEGVQKSLRT